jgi:hypothetical protein
LSPRRMRIGRGLHNEEIHSLYNLPNILRTIKCRRFRWARHVAIIEEGRSVFKILAGKPTEKRALGSPRVDGRTVLDWTRKKKVINNRILVNFTHDRNYWRSLVNASLDLWIA